MAFNPFNVFRRNQKILFALLTIVIMIMFVFSTGLGRGIDFFDWMPRWLGSKRSSGDVMAEIDGSRIRASELARIQDQRDMANLFMAAAHERAAFNIAKYLQEGLTRVSPENRMPVQQVLALRPIYVDQQSIMQRNMMAQFGQGSPVTTDDILAERETTIARLGFLLSRLAESKKEHDAHMAQTAQIMIDTDLRMSGRRNLYFTNQPNSSRKDQLEFMLWQRKADDLGIHFNAETISELIKSEFFHRLNPEDWKAVEDSLRDKRGYTPESLREALAEEFRVRAAQIALMGSNVARPAARLADSPYDFFKLYQELCSTGRYGLISLPAENFLSQVTGEPTDKELRDIFNANKNNEPHPALARPGLKEPRKIKIEWLEVKGDEPFYKTAAVDAAKQLDAMARVGNFLTLPLGGLSAVGPLVGPAALTIPDPLLDSKYEDYKRSHRTTAEQNWYMVPFGGGLPTPLETSTHRPAQVASLAGVMAGSLATGGAAFTPMLVYRFEAQAMDNKARLETLPAALVAPTLPGLGFPAALLASQVVQARATEPLPVSQVRSRLVAQAQDDLARTIANRDLTQFQKDLSKLGTQSDKSEARAAVEKFVKERGVVSKQSKDFHDQFTMHTDENLKPLVDLLPLAAGRFSKAEYVNPLAFGGRFFVGSDGRPSTVPYQAQPYPEQAIFGPSATTPEYLVWRLHPEKEAEVPRTLDDPGVKDKVVAAWRRIKARELAKQAAEDLAKSCENLGTDYFTIYQKLVDKRAELAAKFADPAAKDRVRFFEQDDVAPLVTIPSLGAMARTTTGPFGLNPRIELPFPTTTMADELVKAKDKPISTALVLKDNPEDTYYVAVLTKRNERSPDSFSLSVYSQLGEFSDLGAKVGLRHQAELRKQIREQTVALLKAQYRYEKENEKVNEKIDSPSED